MPRYAGRHVLQMQMQENAALPNDAWTIKEKKRERRKIPQGPAEGRRGGIAKKDKKGWCWRWSAVLAIDGIQMAMNQKANCDAGSP